MANWNYDDAYLRYPCQNELITFDNGSKLRVHDIFNELPSFMLEADLLFVDPPWNRGNLNTFYTKADLKNDRGDYDDFYKILFTRIKEIKPTICYVEVGKQYLADFIIEMRKIFKYVTFYNSSYYHKKDNICYVVRGSNNFKKPKLDYMDEEDIIAWICENEEYTCVGDLCMGRGLVAINATKNKKRFVGTELNHKRLSVTIEKVIDMSTIKLTKRA